MTKTGLKIGKYEARIVVEGQNVTHYGIEVDEERMVATCWIPSTAGKHFGIWVGKHHRKFDCGSRIYLDGAFVKSRARTLSKFNTTPKLMDEVLVDENSVRPFLFGRVHLTDDESALDTRSYEELGTIKVDIHRIKYTGCPVQSAKFFQVPESIKIHEQAKKSATHQIVFGQTKMIERQLTTTYNFQEKVATFVFQYRSLDILRARGIVPPTRPPVETGAQADASASASASGSVPKKRKAPVEVKEEEENNVAEIVAQVEEDRREAELEAELEKIRKARLERQQGDHPKKKVKRELKPTFFPGEIIDLTLG